MRIVRIDNGIVAEIIPDYALPVEKWYGADFAAKCLEAPDEVEQGWIYRDSVFMRPEPPTPPEPTEQEDMAALAVEHEYRLTLLELGVTENAV